MELLVALGLLGLLLGCLLPVARQGLVLVQQSRGQLLAQREARFLAEAISRDVSLATRADVLAPGQLRLLLKDKPDKPCTVVTYTYDETLCLLRREQNSGGAQPLSSGPAASQRLLLRQCAFTLLAPQPASISVRLAVEGPQGWCEVETAAAAPASAAAGGGAASGG